VDSIARSRQRIGFEARLLAAHESVRRPWRLTPVQRLWLASIGLLLAASGLWAGVVRLLPAYATPQLPWWSVVPLFFAADRWPLTVNVRRGTPALGMAAAPLVIGLFYMTPIDVLAAYATGVVLSSLLRRPLGLPQALFAIAQFVVLAGLSEIIFHAFPMATDDFRWAAWLAAASAVGVLVVGNTAAMIVFDHYDDRVRWRALSGKIGYAVGGAVASGCFGLIAVEFIHFTVSGLVVEGVLAAILLAAYRTRVPARSRRCARVARAGVGNRSVARPRAHDVQLGDGAAHDFPLGPG
jgi:hypothetical protein